MSVFVLPDPDTVTLGGLRFAALTEGEVVHRVRTALARGIGGRIATPNVDILRQAALDASIRKDLENADLLVADGAPLVWAARLSGTPDRLPEVVDNLFIQKLKADLATGESKLQQLATQYGVNHPSYENQAADNKIMRERLNAEMHRVVGSIESSSRQSNAQEAESQRALAAQRARVLSMKANRGEMAVLKRNVDSAEKAYDIAMQRYVENQVESHANRSRAGANCFASIRRLVHERPARTCQ